MKRIFESCSILVLGLAATLNTASAQGGNGLEGVWFAEVTAIDCHTGAVIPNVPTFRGLYMFNHDGTLTNEAGFLTASPRRSSGLGVWQHTQAHNYSGDFRFFRYNPDGSFQTLRKVTTVITLDGDHFTSTDVFQDFDANNNPIPSVGCNTVSATRVQ